MTRKSFQACQYDRLTKTTRRWQIHAGSNHFCFNGHCITGRDLSGALLTVFLISFTSTLWFIFICPVLIEELTLVILFVVILLIFYTFSKTTKLSERERSIASSLFLSIDVYGSGNNPSSNISRTFDVSSTLSCE